MRAVFDTTILASLSIATRDPLLFLPTATEQCLFELWISEFIFDELERTLKKPYFESRLPDHGTVFLAMLRHVASLVLLTVTIAGVVSDPNDDPILGTALNVQAHYLVSGDRAVLDVRQFRGISILTARQFYTVSQPHP